MSGSTSGLSSVPHHPPPGTEVSVLLVEELTALFMGCSHHAWFSPPRRQIMRTLLPLFILSACSSPTPPALPVDAPTGEARLLPTLRLEAEANVPELRDLKRGGQVAVTPQGALVFVSAGEFGLRVRHRDGRTLAFGRTGQGPEEVATVILLQATDSAVSYRDPSQQRVVQFGLDGTFLGSVKVSLPYVHMNATAPADSGRVVFAWGPAERTPKVRRVDPRTGATTAVDVAADSFARLWTFREGEEHQAMEPPIPGTWYGGFLLAERNSYTVAFYTWVGERVGIYQQAGGLTNQTQPEAVDSFAAELERMGRQLSPQARERMLNKSQPWFSSSPRIDALGRTWFLVDRKGRAELDVFLGPVLLGNIPLPSCSQPGPRLDLAGRWLAVICAPTDPASDEDAVVQLYEIQ